MSGTASPHVQECAHCAAPEAEYQCGGCARLFYCGAACQRADWSDAHARDCAAIRAYVEDVETGEPLPGGVPRLRTASEVRLLQRRAVQDGKVLVLFFGVDWCKYCKKFKPVFAKLLNRKWNPTRVTGAYVDVETLGSQPVTDQASKLLASEIRKFPTVRLYAADGTLEKTWTGTPPRAQLLGRVRALSG